MCRFPTGLFAFLTMTFTAIEAADWPRFRRAEHGSA